MTQITLSELKAHTGKYVAMANHEVVYVTKNGKRIAKIVNANPDKMTAAKALFGIIPPDFSVDEERKERLS